ncbi:MAG: hypothetical protein CMC15_13335 [Flavobacteriaceae bacterium]|nr:hypothetical protein [Flavobacteriaceae bacterium]
MDIHSETRSKIASALIKARKNMEGAKKKGKGNWGAYATAEDLIEACNEPLLGQDIILTQGTMPLEGKNWVVTQVTHASGEFMRSFTEIVVEKNMSPQKALAGQTYARRGGIESLLAIPRIDDDGENKINTPPMPEPKEPKKTENTLYISEEDRQNFITWATKEKGLNGKQAKELLGELGIESSHKIKADELEEVKQFITNEIKRKGMQELEEMEGDQ